MQINLKECIKDKICEFLDKKFIISKNEFDFISCDDLSLIDDVFVKGNIFVNGNLIKTDFNVFTKFKFVCSRCLESFVHDLDLNCSDEISFSDLDDEDISLDLDQNLTFTDYIKNYIIVNIPQKKVCKVNCLGLCQNCGKNLNYEKCNCQNNVFDNPFSRLREVFVDSKEV